MSLCFPKEIANTDVGPLYASMVPRLPLRLLSPPLPALSASTNALLACNLRSVLHLLATSLRREFPLLCRSPLLPSSLHLLVEFLVPNAHAPLVSFAIAVVDADEALKVGDVETFMYKELSWLVGFQIEGIKVVLWVDGMVVAVDLERRRVRTAQFEGHMLARDDDYVNRISTFPCFVRRG